MASVLEVPRDAERVCECGCGNSLRGMRENARYFTDACRARAFKQRHAENARNAAETPEQRHLRLDREAKERARAAGVIPSDIRVSWQRGVDVLTGYLRERENVTLDEARQVAAEVLRPALPERLRELV